MADITVTKEGRRVWIDIPFGSPAKDKIKALGAHWDATRKQWWIGSGKADEVHQIADEANASKAAARQHVADIKEHGTWIQIPFEAADIREAAKSAGAVWDRERKQWAVPATAVDDIRAKIDDWNSAQKAAAEAVAQRKAEQAKQSAAEVIASSGRTTIGDIYTAGGVVAGSDRSYMRRPDAEHAAPSIGRVLTTKAGRVLIVGGRDVRFVPDFDDEDWGEAVPGMGAHWRWSAQAIRVEPTADERAADDAAAAVEADKAAVRDCIDLVTRATWSVAANDLEVVAGPRILVSKGTGSQSDRIILLDDSTVMMQRTGTYDDYRCDQRTTSDPDVIAAVRAVLAAGTRTVGEHRIEAHA